MKLHRTLFSIALAALLLGPTSAYAFDFDAFDAQLASSQWTANQSNPLWEANKVMNEIVNSHFDGSFQSSLPKNVSWTTLTPTILLEPAPMTIIPTVVETVPVYTTPVYTNPWYTAPPSLPAFTFAPSQPQININASPIVNVNVNSPVNAPVSAGAVTPPSLPFEAMLSLWREPPRVYDFTKDDDAIIIKPAVEKAKITYTAPVKIASTATQSTETTLKPDTSCTECIKDVAETKKLVQEVKDNQTKDHSLSFILLIVIGVISLFTFLRVLFMKNN
jgi:hypothetical protein